MGEGEAVKNKSKKKKAVEEEAAPVEKKKKKTKKKAVEEEAAPVEKKKKKTKKKAAVEEEEAPKKKKKTKKKAKVEESYEGGGGDGELQELMLTCRDCNEEFPFSIEDQQWHIDQGFDNQPSRCKECQRAKKERMNGGPPPCYAFNDGNCDRGDSCRFAHGDSGGGGGGGGGRGG